MMGSSLTQILFCYRLPILCKSLQKLRCFEKESVVRMVFHIIDLMHCPQYDYPGPWVGRGGEGRWTGEDVHTSGAL